MTKMKRGVSFSLLFVMLVWGLNYVSLKAVFETIPVPAAVLLRILIMWGGLALACRILGEHQKAEPGDRWKIWYLGFINMGIYMVIFLSGVNLTSASLAAVILDASPIFTLLGAAIIGRVPWKFSSVAGTVLGISGVAVIEIGSSGVHGATLTGNLLVLAAAVLWAYSALLTHSLSDKYRPMRLLTLSMPGAIPALLVFGASSAISMDWSKVSGLSWIALAYSSLISGVLAFSLFYAGIKGVGPAKATRYQLLVPVFAGFFSWLLLKDQIGLPFFVGGILVIAGLLIAQEASFRKAQNPEPLA